MKTVFFLLATLFVFANCTIQKRTVNKGFYVKWHHNLSAKTKLPTKNIVLNEFANSLLMDSIKEKTQEEDIEILSVFDSKNITAIDETEIESVEDHQNNLNKNIIDNKSINKTSTKTKNTKVKKKGDKIDSENLGFKFFKNLTIGLVLFLIGLILLIFGSSGSYLTWWFAAGLLLDFIASLIIVFSILIFICWRIVKRKQIDKGENPKFKTQKGVFGFLDMSLIVTIFSLILFTRFFYYYGITIFTLYGAIFLSVVALTLLIVAFLKWSKYFKKFVKKERPISNNLDAK